MGVREASESLRKHKCNLGLLIIVSLDSSDQKKKKNQTCTISLCLLAFNLPQIDRYCKEYFLRLVLHLLIQVTYLFSKQ